MTASANTRTGLVWPTVRTLPGTGSPTHSMAVGSRQDAFVVARRGRAAYVNNSCDELTQFVRSSQSVSAANSNDNFSLFSTPAARWWAKVNLNVTGQNITNTHTPV